MTLKGAIAKLERNGWTVLEESPRRFVATKQGQRAINLTGSREYDYVEIITVRTHYGSGPAYQFDAATDVRFCDTIKEAMQAA